MRYRILGIGSGAIDAETDEMLFELTVDGRPPMPFIVGYGPAAQIISALGRMFVELRGVLLEKKAMKASAAEQVESSHVQRDRWEDVVIMQLTTPQGVPYTFRIDPQFASEIADQLKIESAKGGKPGHA
jgi:hypothetical protein